MEIKFNVEANSSKQETDLIWDKIKNIDFFKQHNYSVSFPDHKIIPSLIDKSLDGKLHQNDYQNLSNLMKNEIYNELDYKHGINKINSDINEQMLNFNCFQKYNELWNFKVFSEYQILLTLYGPGGEYRPSSGTIIILTTADGKFRRGLNSLDTIIHEMVHIGLEEIIQQFSIPHKIKEQIVDLFVQFHFSKLLPKYQIQNFGNNSIEKYFKTQDDWNNIIEVLKSFRESERLKSA
jgi:hypothetical protein